MRARLGKAGAHSMLTMDTSKFELVTTPAQLTKWVARCSKATVAAFDTETTGLDPWADKMVGFSLAYLDPQHGIRAAYCPVRHTKAACQGTKQVPVATAVRILKPWLESTVRRKVLHNALFDAHVLHMEGITLAGYDDTMFMAYALEGRNDHGGLGMDYLASKYLKYRTTHFDEVVIPRLDIHTFADVQLDQATFYAAEDTGVTLFLYFALDVLLTKTGLDRVYTHIDAPVMPALWAMKLAGAKVDTGRLSELKTVWAVSAEKARDRAHKIAGRDFNLGSPKQLADVLYTDMKIPCTEFTKTGSPSVAGDTLDFIEHPLVEAILEWRKYTKLITTYCEGLTDKVNPITGRVHTNFNATFTNTRRFSSSQPNLQNIPTRTEEGAEIRGAFTAELGNVLVCCDLSQIEYRILAHVTQAAELLKAFRNGQDLHATMAALAKGGHWTEYADKKKDPKKYKLRGVFKNVNFATIYGAGPTKVALMSGIDIDEAYDLLDEHQRLAPEVYDWKGDVVSFAKRTGYVETVFGARIYIPNLRHKEMSRRGRGERQAVNAVIQGAAADYMRLAISKVYAALRRVPSAELLLTVHDELVVECARADTNRVSEIMKTAMETCCDHLVDWSVPMVGEVDSGVSWKDAKGG